MLLAAGVIAASGACVSYTLATSGARRAVFSRAGQMCVYGTLALVASVSLLLLTLFFLHRFDVAYVFDYSSRELPIQALQALPWKALYLGVAG